MRIAVEAEMSWRNRAGTGHYARSLFGAMEKIAPEHDYLYLRAGDDAPGSKGHLRRLVHGLRRMAWVQFSLPAQIRRQQADLFHAPAMVGPRWQPCPAVFGLLDLAVIEYPQTFDPLWRAYVLFSLRWALPRARAVIAISESTRQDAVRHLGLAPERVKVVYCGADPLFRPIEDGSLLEAARHRLRLPARFVLSVGTLEPRKNIPRLLEAFRCLKDEGDLAHKLVIVGDRGWLYDEVFRQIGQLQLEHDTVLTGYLAREDLVLAYNLADLFVYPSLYEGFGLPPLEAMACGCPVVTSDRSSLPEVVGDAALLVDPEDVPALARAMAALLHRPDKRAELAARGFRQAGRFSWDRAARQTLEIYAEIGPQGAEIP
ncbi:MAG: glycosyltransferase family 1 protein [Anaerolineae bacterium]|jgi:glycosyltransferase involved in cell wall biosynthesis